MYSKISTHKCHRSWLIKLVLRHPSLTEVRAPTEVKEAASEVDGWGLRL